MTLPIWLSEQEKKICEYLIVSHDFAHIHNFEGISKEEQYQWDKEIFARQIGENIRLIYWCDGAGCSDFSVIVNGCLLIQDLPPNQKVKTAKFKALRLIRKIKSLLANWENIRMFPHLQLAFC
ncbi:MAG: hypothetical protein ACKPE3_31925 [Sphaerospermopsis kisseleviana]